mmetsp:Transcript_13315/g.17450  ORF Transcript_13315/g.17450 Transcript_13315/m.17450 type:complete len:467 (-) Transcript_13315:63-1463(-)
MYDARHFTSGMISQSKIARTLTHSTASVSSKPLRIAVCGAGVSGLACVSAILNSTKEKRAAKYGFSIPSPKITVFEKEEESVIGRNIGVGLWSTSLTKFYQHSPSVVEQLVDVGCMVGPNVSYRTSSGAILAESVLSGDKNQFLNYLKGAQNGRDRNSEFHPGMIFVHENELYSTLMRDIEECSYSDNLKIIYGREVHDIDTERGHISFSSIDNDIGNSSYDLIVVADGISSNLRRQLSCGNTRIEDRGYTVFRGNSHLQNHADHSFQTWGTKDSMRFAVCPLRRHLVWFATIDNQILEQTADINPKQFLIECFGHWHSPISDLIASTPDDEIVVEPARAHLESVIPKSSSRIPIHFVGDADMTLDPLLAQGFSIGLEDASNLANALIESPFEQISRSLNSLRERKKTRLEVVRRSTALAQFLAQPRGIIAGGVAQSSRMIMTVTPDFLKRQLFDYTMKYSLGFYL